MANAEGRNPRARKNQGLSDSYAALVDIVFAVVIGESVVRYGSWLLPPRPSVALLALGGVYVTVILSWTGYHRSLLKFPYADSPHSLFRLFADFGIVLAYALMLDQVDAIDQAGEIRPYLALYILVFLGYILSGALRLKEYPRPPGKPASHQGKLWVAVTGYAVLLLAYDFAVRRYPGDALGALRTVAVLASVAIYLGWRWWRRPWGK